ncbi:MAG: hypothetical protein R6T90_09510 [Dissulfuribacterales bacterium]
MVKIKGQGRSLIKLAKSRESASIRASKRTSTISAFAATCCRRFSKASQVGSARETQIMVDRSPINQMIKLQI